MRLLKDAPLLFLLAIEYGKTTPTKKVKEG
jgi:hypothetical protein